MAANGHPVTPSFECATLKTHSGPFLRMVKHVYSNAKDNKMQNKDRKTQLVEVKQLEEAYRELKGMPSRRVEDGQPCPGYAEEGAWEKPSGTPVWKTVPLDENSFEFEDVPLDVEDEEDEAFKEWVSGFDDIYNSQVYAQRLSFLVLDHLDIIWEHQDDARKKDDLLENLKEFLTVTLRIDRGMVQ